MKNITTIATFQRQTSFISTTFTRIFSHLQRVLQYLFLPLPQILPSKIPFGGIPLPIHQLISKSHCGISFHDTPCMYMKFQIEQLQFTIAGVTLLHVPEKTINFFFFWIRFVTCRLRPEGLILWEKWRCKKYRSEEKLETNLI